MTGSGVWRKAERLCMCAGWKVDLENQVLDQKHTNLKQLIVKLLAKETIETNKTDAYTSLLCLQLTGAHVNTSKLIFPRQ